MTHTIAATKANEAVERLARAAHHAVDRAAAKADSLSDVRDAWVEAAGNRVRERPLRSVLIAVAAGLVIGRLLR